MALNKKSSKDRVARKQHEATAQEQWYKLHHEEIPKGYTVHHYGLDKSNWDKDKVILFTNREVSAFRMAFHRIKDLPGKTERQLATDLTISYLNGEDLLHKYPELKGCKLLRMKHDEEKPSMKPFEKNREPEEQKKEDPTEIDKLKQIIFFQAKEIQSLKEQLRFAEAPKERKLPDGRTEIRTFLGMTSEGTPKYKVTYKGKKQSKR